MITSTRNERIQYVRSLARRRVRWRERTYVVEGTRLVRDMIGAGVKPALVLYTEAWASAPSGQDLLPLLALAAQEHWLVSDAAFATCADTMSPQGVLAVVGFSQIPPRPGLVLIMDSLRDPGNLGTILRSAEAAGIGQVVLTPETVDVYNPKVVRSAMGAHFYLPMVDLDWPAIRKLVAGRMVWLADAAGEISYDAVDWTAPAALIVGGEAAGARDQAASLAMSRVSIPMVGRAESLNAAMAASVILFEVARQRRAGAPRQ